MADSGWNSGGRDGRLDACPRQAGFFQTAGGPAIRRQKLAGLFAYRKLHTAVGHPDHSSMVNPFFQAMNG